METDTPDAPEGPQNASRAEIQAGRVRRALASFVHHVRRQLGSSRATEIAGARLKEVRQELEQLELVWSQPPEAPPARNNRRNNPRNNPGTTPRGAL